MVLVILVYVDDIIVTSSNSLLIEQLISSLNSCFALKDLGPLNFFLGIKVFSSSSSLYFSQARYISDFFFFSVLVCLNQRPWLLQWLLAGHVLSIVDGTRLEDPTLYRSLMGALQCAQSLDQTLLILLISFANLCMLQSLLIFKL